MAISIDTTLDTGFVASGTYSRVEALELSKDSMSFTLRHYKQKGLPFFKEARFSCSYDINGSNPFEQAYVYLKSLNDFSTATDC